MSNQFWVEPENLGRSGSGYAESEQGLHQLAENAQNLMVDYSSAFGTNNGSEQFLDSFQQGMGQHMSELKNRAATMGQMSSGLQANGRSYSQSEDSAGEASQQLLSGMGNGSEPVQQERQQQAQSHRAPMEPLRDPEVSPEQAPPQRGEADQAPVEPLQSVPPVQPGEQPSAPLRRLEPSDPEQAERGAAFVPRTTPVEPQPTQAAVEPVVAGATGEQPSAPLRRLEPSDPEQAERGAAFVPRTTPVEPQPTQAPVDPLQSQQQP